MKKRIIFLAIILLSVYFVFSNIISMTVTSPANDTWTTDTTPSFVFTYVSSSNSTFSCEVFLQNGTGLGLNQTVSNSTSTTMVSNETLSEGVHIWYVNCTDNESTNMSVPRTLTVDYTNPSPSITNLVNESWTTDTTPEINFTIIDNLDTALNYTVFIDDTSNLVGTANNNTPTVRSATTLAQGQYTINVEAYDNAGNRVNSSIWTLTVDPTAPTVSAQVYPSDGLTINNTYYVNFNFSSYDNLDTVLNYTLFINGVINQTGVTAGNNTYTNHTVINFDVGTYTWIVQVQDEALSAVNYSSAYTFTIADTIPTNTVPILMPGNVSDSDSDGNIEIVWTADPSATYYRVYRALYNMTNVTGLTALATVTATSFEDNTTVHGTTYWYTVSSLDSSLNENKSRIANSTSALANDSIAPRLPTGIAAVTNADGSVTVSWNAVTLDITGEDDDESIRYYVFRTSNVTSLNTSKTTEMVSNTTSTSLTQTSIVTGTYYHYVVTAIDDGQNHNGSKTANVTITAAACTTDYGGYSEWSSCAGGATEKTRTRTRTCYGGGETSDSETGSCPSTTRSSSSTSSTPSNPKQVHQWSFVDQALMKITDEEIGVTEIEIKLRNVANDVKLTIEKLAEKPAAVAESSGKVYKYLKVDKALVDDSEVDSGKFTFKVAKSWLTTSGISLGQIVLMRFTDTWTELATTMTGEDTAYAYYEAETPGFSYFAIAERSEPVVEEVVEEIVEEVQEPVVEQKPVAKDPVKEEKKVEEQPKKSNYGTYLLGFMVFVLVVGAGYYLLNKAPGKKETPFIPKHETKPEPVEEPKKEEVVKPAKKHKKKKAKK